MTTVEHPAVPTASGPASARRPRTVRRIAAGLVAVALLTTAACGSHHTTAASTKSRPSSQPVSGGAKLAAVWPLTGLPVDAATPNHPVLVTKIDNTENSRPQLGLSKADLITEELVEGGITRLAVFFYTQLPSVAGPVRSMRASDIGIVEPAHGVLVASGAAPPTIARIKGEHIPFFTEGGPGYYRDSGRRAPYNLLVHLMALAKAVRDKSVVPASYLPFGTESQFTGVGQATTIQAIFSPSHTTRWRFAGGKYHDLTSNAAAGQQFTPDNVLVLRVREGDAGYLDPAGHHVPETLYSGSGPAILFHGGKLVRGTWHKSSRRTPLQLTTASGQLTVPAGRTWIELVPMNRFGGSVAFQP